MFENGKVVLINGFNFPLLVQYIICSKSAFVSCVEPRRFVPLKNRNLKSIVESYPVVAPVATNVPPIFSRDTSCGNTFFPMCSNTISTPPSFFVISLTFLYQSGSLWFTTLAAPSSKHLSISAGFQPSQLRCSY